ncbi:MAG: DNA-processing protein DprA [Bacillota bacterium]|nr:DNA-processing protein DprA [Bacillota bacterium]
MTERDMGIIEYGDKSYPPMLSEIKDPPKRLYYVGNLELLNLRCVSVVGSRTTTTYGRNTAKAIGRTLSQRGACVVSGMAKGIDTCAHEGALEAGGKTIAVLGCGVDVCFPRENRILKAEIERRGLIVSEYPLGTEPHKWNFPRRNRIISGLSQMTVVVQARNRSGALITAELAAEQGREVMAVPGNIDSQFNLGNNKLIREGVMPLISVEDVLEPLNLRTMDEETARKNLSEMEYLVYKQLVDNGEMSIDELCIKLNKTPGYINPIVSVLEMKGMTFSELGKIFLANI